MSEKQQSIRIKQMLRVQEEAKNADSYNFEGDDAIEKFFYSNDPEIFIKAIDKLLTLGEKMSTLTTVTKTNINIELSNNKELRELLIDIHSFTILIIALYDITDNEMQDNPFILFNKYEDTQKKTLEIFKKKNADYGDSFAIYGTIGVIVRLGDKFLRIKSLIKKKNYKGNVLEESLIDTLLDIVNYAAMAVMLLDE